MAHENTYTGIILKKQPFGEADEIITFYTKEAGKLRGLAKSVKLAKSKLQSRLQMLFLVSVGSAGKNLPKIISVEVLETYQQLRENLSAAKMGFYASELIMKLTADEEPNEALFFTLSNFLQSLNKAEVDLEKLQVEFKIQALENVGLSITHADSKLQNLYKEYKANGNTPTVQEFNRLLSEFIEYQIERKIKSEKYLDTNMV